LEDFTMRLIVGILVFALLLTSGSAAQQFIIGVIQGTVTDTTGDNIPGVSVEARHLETNQARTVTSGADGRYNLLQLPPGTYRVTFTLPGFASHVQENVVLTIGQSITLPIALKVAGVAETVTVRTSPGVVESTRTSAATTLNERTVETLPILGRKFEDRRRRDYVRGPARHLQQHQPRRRRLQQRVLRGTGGRAARGHRHHAGRGQGIPGHRDRRASRVRPHRRRRRQRDHQVGHQPAARLAVLFPAARGAHRRALGRHQPG
jgi:hypothetical protein